MARQCSMMKFTVADLNTVLECEVNMDNYENFHKDLSQDQSRLVSFLCLNVFPFICL